MALMLGFGSYLLKHSNMLYYLFEFLESKYDLPGAGVFQFISFRTLLAFILSLIISIIIGNRIIRSLKRLQIGESVRDLGLEGQLEKAGTPTMGGVIILMSILVPCLLLTKLDNIYIITLVIAAIWMAIIGFIDDYIKVFKKDKKGLKGRSKVLGQVGLGFLIGVVMLFHNDVVVRMNKSAAIDEGFKIVSEISGQDDGEQLVYAKSSITNIPFLKNNQLDYRFFVSFLGDNASSFLWIVFIPIIILIVTAVTNGANLTDGIDGLATGVSAIIGATLGIFAYVSSNSIIADYLNILYLPFTGEVVVFAGCFVGACIGFLWHNSFPASVFMGDTGSLALGGIIAAMAILLRKELLIPIFCGVFLVETVSVVMQVSYFKYTKRKYGEGKRIFLMSPLHHHYQKLGIHESKIVIRFWIVGILLAMLSIITLKLQ